MQLQLEKLLPTYFENIRSTSSEVWGKDLKFDRQEYIKIVAPSGSGKSSLMHFLYGLRKEYNGNVKYDGKDIRNFSVEELSLYRKDHISIVFQDLRLFPEQTVRQNIELKRQLNPFHPPTKIVEMCERLGIGNKLASTCRTCSYGEQQRIAIIRSLMQPFDILLLDEPFSHLDENNSQKAMQLMLEEARTRNASIIFVDLERSEIFPYTQLYHL